MDDTIELTLESSDGAELQLLLRGPGQAGLPAWRTAEVCVFSDLHYTLKNTETLSSARIYLNDVPVLLQSGGSSLRPIGNGQIFRDFYDWVQISAVIDRPDQDSVEYRSAHLPVMVAENDPLVQELHRMVAYIHEHSSSLLLEGDMASRKLVALQAGTEKQLEGRLHLARQILDGYARLYSFFRTNCRFEMRQVPEVMPFNRLRRIEPETLHYITAHPDLLQAAAGETSLRWGRQSLEPVRSLGKRDVPSSDIYENQVVCRFLHLVAQDLGSLQKDCARSYAQVTGPNEHRDGYVCFTDALQRVPKRKLRHLLEEIDSLLSTCRRLSLQYEKALGVSPQVLDGMPRATEIFFHVDQYARIFRMIHEWHTLGPYDLTGKDFFISLAGAPTIYESYVLARLIGHFESEGWTVCGTREVQTPGMEDETPSWGRIVELQRDGLQLRIYQQPLLRDGCTASSCPDACGLYRNNVYVYERKPGSAYYRPDFVLAATDGRTERFLVLDAKHSYASTVAKNQMADLLFKYITSLSPARPNGELRGLAVCCGRGSPDWKVNSVYNRSWAERPPHPPASWITLNEPAGSARNRQDAMLHELFRDLLTFDA